MLPDYNASNVSPAVVQEIEQAIPHHSVRYLVLRPRTEPSWAPLRNSHGAVEGLVVSLNQPHINELRDTRDRERHVGSLVDFLAPGARIVVL